MAETAAGSRNSFGFLTRKLGPLPVWAWAAIVVGAYYLWTKYQSGSSSSSGANATDPATGVTYAQELSDAEDQITQLQAQLNAQQQGQVAPGPTTINVSETETSPGSGTPAPSPPPPSSSPPSQEPKTGAEKKIPSVAGERASYAISAIEAAGFETHTSPYRDPHKEYVATGTSPSGQARAGSVVVIHVRQASATTKTKKAARPARKARTTATVPPKFTRAQIARAYAPGRAAAERGKLFVHGKWVRVPKAAA